VADGVSTPNATAATCATRRDLTLMLVLTEMTVPSADPPESANPARGLVAI